MNEMIRDRRSIEWNKKHPRSWHSEGVFFVHLDIIAFLYLIVMLGR